MSARTFLAEFSRGYFLANDIKIFFWLTLTDDVFQLTSTNAIFQTILTSFPANFGWGYFLVISTRIFSAKVGL